MGDDVPDDWEQVTGGPICQWVIRNVTTHGVKFIRCQNLSAGRYRTVRGTMYLCDDHATGEEMGYWGPDGLTHYVDAGGDG